jgi:transposase-like protein
LPKFRKSLRQEGRKDTPVRNNEWKNSESQIKEAPKSILEEIIREGARKLLQEAIENEVTEYLERVRGQKDTDGRQLVVRNGSLPTRELLTGIGPLMIKQRRVRDRRGGEGFSSNILPRYMRRVPSVDKLIPVLYLKGISTGDFTKALEAILGENASGLSATNIVRLKRQWEQEYQQWAKRNLSGKRYVYFWADGIHFNVRLEEPGNDRQCILVIMGALEDGRKEMVSVVDGYRESKESWRGMLRDLRRRGLKEVPRLAVGDGGLGFWAALEEEFPQTREQRCWVHKTCNILDKMPKSMHPKLKAQLREMYTAPTKEAALKAYEEFLVLYQAKYDKACECLRKDKDVLFTFYDFPAEHWVHIRTTNPIESTFGTVRHRTRKTKGCGSRLATLTMVFKLSLEAQKTWKKLKGHQLIVKVIEGVKFVDGEMMQEAA